MKDLIPIVKLIKSVCPDCRGTGKITTKTSINLCETCKGKGHQTFEELEESLDNK